MVVVAIDELWVCIMHDTYAHRGPATVALVASGDRQRAHVELSTSKARTHLGRDAFEAVLLEMTERAWATLISVEARRQGGALHLAFVQHGKATARQTARPVRISGLAHAARGLPGVPRDFLGAEGSVARRLAGSGLQLANRACAAGQPFTVGIEVLA